MLRVSFSPEARIKFEALFYVLTSGTQETFLGVLPASGHVVFGHIFTQSNFMP